MSQPYFLTVSVTRGFDDCPLTPDEWDAAVLRLGGRVYTSFDWLKTWWEHYGAGKELRLLVFREREEIVGLMPLYIDCVGWWPCQIRVARLLGASIPPKPFKLPVRPSGAGFVFEAALEQLLRLDRCHVVSIGPLSESAELLQAFENAARHSEHCASVTRQAAGVHTVFRLPATLEAFFETMDKDERKKRKYELRLLNKQPAIRHDVLSESPDVEAEFEGFVRLHALQWREKGKLGHFGSWPRGREYNHALVRALAKRGRVRFVRILSGNEVISSQYAFLFGNTCYWELPARLMDREWSRYSLGTSGFFSLVEEAIKMGCSQVEGGLAQYDYKRKLGGTEQPLYALRIVARLPGSRLRALLSAWLRAWLRLGYLKVYYNRLQPRLPKLFRKPYWRLWLRLDF